MKSAWMFRASPAERESNSSYPPRGSGSVQAVFVGPPPAPGLPYGQFWSRPPSRGGPTRGKRTTEPTAREVFPAGRRLQTMGIARSLERRLERLADGISAAVFRGRMHPVDLANRLVRQADLLVTDQPAGPGIPNRFEVSVNDHDLEPSIDITSLTAELERTMRSTAADRGWMVQGPIGVRIIPDGTVGRGSIRCSAQSEPGTLRPWAELAEHRGARSFEIGDNRALVGRAGDAAIRLEEPEVSRHHGVVFREAEGVWIVDLQSANGTTVNGRAVTSEPAPIGSGDMLSFGPATFAFRVL